MTSPTQSPRQPSKAPRSRLVARRRSPHAQGFTLIEIILVISLFIFLYTVALPQISYRTGTETATKLGRLSADFRAAYDQAVLSGRPHRLVFELQAGKYYLEAASTQDVRLGDEKSAQDMTAEQEEDARAEFEEKMKTLAEMLPEPPKSDSDEAAPPKTSPVLAAKDALAIPTWERVANLEWSERQLGPFLQILAIQAEHHVQRQVTADLSEDARAVIYFFPSGYVERAMILIGTSRDAGDQAAQKYTLITDPVAGTADVKSGEIEFNVESEEVGG